MTMIVSIKPKAGRLATGSYGDSPIDGNCFPKSPGLDPTLPNPGGVSMLQDRTATQYRHPNASAHDTATQQNTSALMQVANNPTTLVETMQDPTSGHNVPEIMPHEKPSFFRRKIIPTRKTQFGATGEKDSNTAFHPKKSDVLPENRPISAMATAENEFLPSFVSNNHLWVDPNNSFLGGRPNPAGNGVGSGRWNTTKRSVV